MEMLKEILIKLLSNAEMNVSFPQMEVDLAKAVELECYQALKRIKSILEDDTLDDPDCFYKIEEIVLAFEEMGSSCGNRHDFG